MHTWLFVWKPLPDVRRLEARAANVSSSPGGETGTIWLVLSFDVVRFGTLMLIGFETTSSQLFDALFSS